MLCLFSVLFLAEPTIPNGPSPWGDEDWTKPTNDKNKVALGFGEKENPSTDQSVKQEKSLPNETLTKNTKSTKNPMTVKSPVIALSPSTSTVQPNERKPFNLDCQQSLNASRNNEKLNTDYQDPWSITSEQRRYYTKQFTSMQENVEGKIDGICVMF